jgi:hypothetical protein
MHEHGPHWGDGAQKRLSDRARLGRWFSWLATAFIAVVFLAFRRMLHVATCNPKSVPPPFLAGEPPTFSGQRSVRSRSETVASVLKVITAIALLIGAIAGLVSALHVDPSPSPVTICHHVVFCGRPRDSP